MKCLKKNQWQVSLDMLTMFHRRENAFHFHSVTLGAKPVKVMRRKVPNNSLWPWGEINKALTNGTQGHKRKSLPWANGHKLNTASENYYHNKYYHSIKRQAIWSTPIDVQEDFKEKSPTSFHYNNNEQTNNMKVLSTANMFNMEQLNGVRLRAEKIHDLPQYL